MCLTELNVVTFSSNGTVKWYTVQKMVAQRLNNMAIKGINKMNVNRGNKELIPI